MKKILLTIMIITMSLLSTACFKRDNLEDITIYATAYPIEYIVDYLYGEHSTVYSIYPNGTDISKYSLTSKQIEDYSNMDMFIFNGLTDEQSYVNPLFKYNKNLKIIDASQSMEYTYNQNELWLDPSNFLMLALNIKNGLSEYIENHYLLNNIQSNYEGLKIQISNLDAEFMKLYKSSSNKIIIIDNNEFKFLEKYGFKVISLDEETSTNKNVIDAKTAIQNGTSPYIFTTNSQELNDTVTSLKEETDATIIELHDLDTLTEEEKYDKEDYLSIMMKNIDNLKTALYK